jgi:hypothetical protein
MPADGYYWARIKHTGELEIVEISGVRLSDDRVVFVVSRIGDEQTLELDQVEIVKAIPVPEDGT